MGKITIKIDRFDGGISSDLRSKTSNKYSITKHFDTFSYPHRLVPRQKSAAITGEDKTVKIVKMIWAPYGSATVFRLWGFGSGATDKVVAQTYNEAGGIWEAWSGQSSGARWTQVFFHYNNYVYSFHTTTKLGRNDCVAGSGYADFQTVATITSLAEPVYHPADDNAYFFVNNVVHVLTRADAWSTGLTLPTNLKIACACAHGDYLAIGCAPIDATLRTEHSIVYLWDRDSSLATLTARYDFGQGAIKHLASLDGRLIGVVDTGIGNLNLPIEAAVLICEASGTTMRILNRIPVDDGDYSSPFTDTRAVKYDKLYFPLKATLDGDTRLGIWSVDSSGRTTIDYVEEEATSYEHILPFGDTWYICHSGDYSTNISSTYNVLGTHFSTTLASIYESLIFDGGDTSQKKKLLGVTVMFEPLPTAGQVVLKYKLDADLDAASWTTIFTHTTDDSLSHSAVNRESGGVQFPEFKEIQFQISSTGGAVITGLKCRYEIVGKDIYD